MTVAAMRTFRAVILVSALIASASSLPFATKCTCPKPKKVRPILQLWRVSRGMVMLGACSFYMGSDSSVAIRGDREDPVREAIISTPFWIDKTEVTRGEFSRFVHSTQYVTTAEELGSSFVFGPKNNAGTRGNFASQPGWWIEKQNVTWKTDLTPVMSHHPVIHVSWADAIQYCNWRKGSLPSEIQWEFACRGGLEKCLYPWGNKLRSGGIHMTNIWQGRFPLMNSMEDGFEMTAPVKSFLSNGYGLHDIVGNVWEWVLDSWELKQLDVRIQKGGSFMCHRMHCYRYRCGARTKASADSTSSNVGFRCSEQLL